MRIWNLIEDTSGENGCRFEHGLSFYLETEEHKVLVDTGATGLFLVNAKLLGVDLKQVDTVILSHGHYDHSGGILAFANMNPNAKIYVRENVFENYCRIKGDGYKYIGVDKEIANLPQVIRVKGDFGIDSELFLFTDVSGRKYWPKGNLSLKVNREGDILQDDFTHEQYLRVKCEGKAVLLSGCAHNGILNILDRYVEMNGHEPDAVFSGFHMMKHDGYTEEDREIFRDTAQELTKYKTRFFTGHCTGAEPFQMMKEIMGDQIVYIHSGEYVEL